jgi:Nidogen-like
VPSPRLADLQRVIFAPFWADADTTTNGSGSVGWGCGCGFAVPGKWRPAFGVTWRNVGYYKGGADKSNGFQMLIIDRSDRGRGSFDLQYRYAAIQWDTADPAFGRDGLCDLGAGFPARVGYANGTNCPPVELTGSGVCGALLDTGGNALINGSLGQGPAGVYTWHFTNTCFAPNGP